MIAIKSPLSIALGAALIAGTVALSGCGPAPVTRTTTTTEQITTTPAPIAPMPPMAPMGSTTTTETQQFRSH